jgi:hypothetical protein
MNETDEMRLVTDLEPVMLNRLAEDGYARHRDGDLTRAMAEAPARGKRSRYSPAVGRRRRALLTGVVAVTAAAAAAFAVAAQTPATRPHVAAQPLAPRPHMPSQTGLSPVTTSARGFLLTSALRAGNRPAASGTYWYTEERAFGPTEAFSRQPRNAPPGSPAQKKVAPPAKTVVNARLAYSEQIWMGDNRARTITNENVAISFASPADEAAWKAAGKPPILTANGFSDKPVTSDYHMSFHWGVGSAQFTWADLRRLTSGPVLDAALRQMWNREPDKAGQFGTTSYSRYIFQWAAQLLTAPVQPAIRAATYRLLAAQPGLVTVGTVTDPDGRSGVAVSDGAGDFLIINSATAEAMAYGMGTLHQGEVISASAGAVLNIEVYQVMGWTSQLGALP